MGRVNMYSIPEHGNVVLKASDTSRCQLVPIFQKQNEAFGTLFLMLKKLIPWG